MESRIVAGVAVMTSTMNAARKEYVKEVEKAMAQAVEDALATGFVHIDDDNTIRGIMLDVREKMLHG